MNRVGLFFLTILLYSGHFCSYANGIISHDSINYFLNSNRQDTAYVNMLNNKSRELYMSEPQKALEFAIKGKEISIRIGFKKGLADCLLSIGSAYYFQNEFQKALDNFLEAKDLFRDINDTKGLANCLNNIGLIYIDLNNHSLAQEYFKNSLMLYDSIGFNNGIITGYNNMARNYYQTGNPNKALEYLNYAIEVYASTDNPDINAYIMCYNNMAIIELEQKKYQSALKYLNKAKEVALHNNFRKQLSLVYVNMSHVYLAQNETESAIKCLDTIMQIAGEFDDDIAIVNAHTQYANIYSKERDFRQSIIYANKAMDKNIELGLTDMQITLHHILFNAFKEVRDFEAALRHLEAYKALNDSVFSAMKNKHLLEVEAVYQIDKKAKENELLKKDNIIKDLDILRKEKQRNYLLISFFFIISFAIVVLYFYINKKKANAVLQEQRNKLKYINGKLNEALALKDTFLSILSHDLRSPVLALGSSLEKLKTADIKQEPDVFQVHMDLFEKQYETTKNLLENLLLWANAQSDKLPYKREKLFIKELIWNCINVYSEAAQQKNVEITSSVSDNLEVYADKFMLESVLRNLIFNALKFSYEGGQINISVQEKAENILITVSDTGTGISEDDLEKLFSVGQNFSKSGTSGEKGTGLGLLLCKEFVEKNGGTIWAESTKGKGSRFCFTLLK